MSYTVGVTGHSRYESGGPNVVTGVRVSGGMAERLNAAVLKTVEAQVSGGSNPSPSVLTNIYRRPLFLCGVRPYELEP